jgi:integrase
MPLMMARPFKHPTTGMYWFRRVVPEELRALVGKREEKRSLRTKDPEEAKRRFVEVLSAVEAKWASLKAGSRDLTEREAHEFAQPVYEGWLNQHRDNPSFQLLWHHDRYGELWTSPGYDPKPGSSDPVPITQIFFSEMRRACFDKADHIAQARGLILDHWGRFTLAKAVGAAFQRASLVLADEANGIYQPGAANTPHLGSVPSTPDAPPGQPFTFEMLLEEWKRERQPRLQVAYEAANMLRKLEGHVGYSDARRLTADDLISWKEALQADGLAARTVRDGRFAILRAMLAVAVQNRKLPANPAADVKVTVKLDAVDPVRGYTDIEAAIILNAASASRDPVRRWIPLLCAYSGARLGEICQLRVEDVREIDGIRTISFTHEAGPLKNRRSARTIPLHPVVLEAGFLAFVESRQAGVLFPELLLDRFGKRSLNGSKAIGRWVRKLGITDPRLKSSHSWRHRFRTASRTHGLAVDVVDAILGHTRGTVGDSYGEYPPKAMLQEMVKLPDILAVTRKPVCDRGPTSAAVGRCP